MRITIVVASILLSVCATSTRKRHFDATILSLASNSTDESKSKLDLRVDRVSHGETVLNGIWEWQFDVDNTTMLETTFYSSDSGSENEYKKLPHGIPPISFEEFLDQHYNDIIYENFKNCSNLKAYKNKVETPWQKGTYTLNQCRPKGHGMPEILADGFYKIYIRLSADPEIHIVVVFKISNTFY
ncbi:uncharacterized protein Dmoj_GI23934 [Drosophila mojavensis]|uniref:Uncharacterized protein n=1 Tax=Drosophila mojavensis TaxID=7230 RepID=B4KDK9_DROMO|nr:uncharacterized protein Dmoj_GI23934 [Drosophila mojavensis]